MTDRHRAWVVCVALVAGLLSVPTVAAAAPTEPTSPAVSATSTDTPCRDDGPERTYLVLHDPGTALDAVDTELRGVCATRIAYHPEIGVAVARSRADDVVERLGVDRAWSGEGAERSTRPRAWRPVDDDLPRSGLSAQQWDMRQIRVPEAHGIDRGRPEVTVGVMDDGVEADHPALARTLDRQRSVGCVGGVERREVAAWDATVSDHGTHVAATIAGDDPDAGFTGVAPGARVASVRVLDDDDMVYPEAVICGVMWSARQGFAAVNASFWTDPGLFFCRDRAGEAVALEAVGRAVRHASGVGTVVVAASGNDGFDATAPRTDPESGRPVGPGCAIIPSGVDGVIAVGATGFGAERADYSNWGTGFVDLAAPGGDENDAPPDGEGPACPVSATEDGTYGPMCGTSMAAPHVAGVAALLAGRVPRTEVAETLLRQARPLPCPDSTCETGDGATSYYGAGLVDALEAVRTPER